MSPLLTDSFNVSALEMIFQNDIQNLSEFNSQCLDAFLDHSDFFKHFNSPRYLKAIGFNTLAPNRCITLSVSDTYLMFDSFKYVFSFIQILAIAYFLIIRLLNLT
jgi:hypothetical protein